MNRLKMIQILSARFGFVQGMLALCVLLTGTACTPQQMYEAQLNKPNPKPKSEQCPAPGSPMPFSQVWSDASHVVGCDVVSQVVLIGALEGCPRRLVANAGDRCFQVAAPTEYSAGAASPMASHVMLAPKNSAPLLYQTKTGTMLNVRGVMAVDEDLGTLAFVASGVLAAPPTTVQAQQP